MVTSEISDLLLVLPFERCLFRYFAPFSLNWWFLRNDFKYLFHIEYYAFIIFAVFSPTAHYLSFSLRCFPNSKIALCSRVLSYSLWVFLVNICLKSIEVNVTSFGNILDFYIKFCINLWIWIVLYHPHQLVRSTNTIC